MFVKAIEEQTESLYTQNTNVLAPPQPKSPKSSDATSQAENVPPQITAVCAVPVVLLDTDSIATDMAACLACSLLEHVLFLKSQIPL